MKLSNVSFNLSEFHKKGVGLIQNHQLPTLIQIKTALKQFKFCNLLFEISVYKTMVEFSFIFYKHWVEWDLIGEGLQKLGLCSALGAVAQGGSLLNCDTGPWFFWSHLFWHTRECGGPILTWILRWLQKCLSVMIDGFLSLQSTRYCYKHAHKIFSITASYKKKIESMFRKIQWK
jgi:hypothetical protein